MIQTIHIIHSVYTDKIYIADYYNHRIRQVNNGVITTIAGTGSGIYGGDGGAATSASFNQPIYVLLDSAGRKYTIVSCSDITYQFIFQEIFTSLSIAATGYVRSIQMV